jgi:hypothetical protein
MKSFVVVRQAIRQNHENLCGVAAISRAEGACQVDKMLCL